MRAVLYADDFEPITVIDLNRQILGYIEERCGVNLAVWRPFEFAVPEPSTPVAQDVLYVRINAERLLRGRHETWMLFTPDEEAALLLKSAFLPGQTSAVREREQRAFARGFLDAIERLGR